MGPGKYRRRIGVTTVSKGLLTESFLFLEILFGRDLGGRCLCYVSLRCDFLLFDRLGLCDDAFDASAVIPVSMGS